MHEMNKLLPASIQATKQKPMKDVMTENQSKSYD